MRPHVAGRLLQQHSHNSAAWTHSSAVQTCTGTSSGHVPLHAAVTASADNRRVRTCASGDDIAGADGGQKRVYLITGSTDGIGRHTALKLAQTGATVLVHGRDPKRVSDTVAFLSKVSGSSSSSSSSSRIHGYTADLSDLSAVRHLAAAVAADHPRLTALINNAGVYETQRRLSVDGYEMTWAVNVLAPFLLTSLLWQHVDEAIITTASISAANSISMQQLQQQQQQQQQYSAHAAYSLSKLCDIIFTLHLHTWLRQHGSSIKANTLDPGTVNTKMLLAGWGRIGMEIGEADNTFKLLTDARLGGTSGKYFVGHRETRPPSIAEDPKVQQQLWELWTQQTGAEWSV